LAEIAAPQGMAAESASTAVILASSHLGFALSTTHVATGSILGGGVGRSGAEVRWRVAGRMVIAGVLTLPAAGVVGALMWWIARLVGGAAGSIVVFVILRASAGVMYGRSGKKPVNPGNVNDEWQETAPTVLAGTAG
jgi:inorganic phosphate transporter, PiT family